MRDHFQAAAAAPHQQVRAPSILCAYDRPVNPIRRMSGFSSSAAPHIRIRSVRSSPLQKLYVTANSTIRGGMMTVGLKKLTPDS
jgi:hypothetical protein